MKRYPTLIGCVLAGIAITSCAAGNAASSTTPTTATRAGASSDVSSTDPPDTVEAAPLDTVKSLQQHFVDVVAVVRPSVVQISTSSGLGSGIVFDDKGDIVT